MKDPAPEGPYPVCFAGTDEPLGICVLGLRLVLVPALCAIIHAACSGKGHLSNPFAFRLNMAQSNANVVPAGHLK